MEIAIKLAYQVGILFLMMIPGVIMKKAGFADERFGKGLSGLVLYIAQPALIFLAYLRPYDKTVFINSLWVLLFALLSHLLFAAVSLLLYRKAPDGQQRMLRMATVFGNAAFMGVPVVGIILGAEALLYASIYNIVFNLVLWSFGVFICTRGKDQDGDGDYDAHDRSHIKKTVLFMLRSALLHPVTLAAALGLVFFFFPIENAIPDLLVDALSMLQNLVAPLSMIIIGLRLADMKLKGCFRDGNMYLCLAMRHLLLPFGVMLFMKGVSLLGVPIDPTVVSVVLILAATPIATSSTMFAERYDCDAPYISRVVTLSTILSIVTMPALILLSQLIF